MPEVTFEEYGGSCTVAIVLPAGHPIDFPTDVLTESPDGLTYYQYQGLVPIRPAAEEGPWVHGHIFLVPRTLRAYFFGLLAVTLENLLGNAVMAAFDRYVDDSSQDRLTVNDDGMQHIIDAVTDDVREMRAVMRQSSQ